MMRKLFALVMALFAPAGALLGACTATEKNADYSVFGGPSTSMTANINAVGDLVAITAFCNPASGNNCSFSSVTLGSQTAVQTVAPVAQLLSGGIGTGVGTIYYVLSAATAGNVTLTVNGTGASNTQVSYIDFTPTAGCHFSHDIDSPLGAGVGSGTSTGTINAPSITPNAGDLLFNFTWTSEHVNSVNSPWSCPIYSGFGETQTCEFNVTINAAAYILSAPSSSTTNNMTDIHASDSWQALITSFSLSGSGSGATNGCPSGALVTGNHCYFIAANGSDANSGSSESSPWLHAPGMPSCTGNCAAHTPVAGEGFIFRGGDTWHFKNTGAAPYTGGKWIWTWSGNSSGGIYVGVDKTWYTGASWTRPIMSGDNATSTSPVSSCTYDESTFNFLNLATTSYNTFDNLEFTGLCWHGNQANANESICCAGYIAWNGTSSTPSNNTLENFYIHGWTHVSFSCSTSGGEPTGNCDGAFGITGSADSSFGIGDQIIGVVIDGSDSDPHSLMGIQWACYDVHDSVIRYNSNGAVCNNNHTWHDNLEEYIEQSGDGVTHSNAVEFNTESTTSSINLFYNNIDRHLFTGGGCTGEVAVWITPQTSEYIFNNLEYDKDCNANFFDLTAGSGWNAYVFNNTWVLPDSGAVNANPSGTTAYWYNNHCLVPGGGTASSCYAGSGTLHYLTNVVQDTTVASGQGYVATETFAYSPTAQGNATVGTGTNEQAYCSALSSAGFSDAATACQSDTKYSCTYDTTSRSVSCPARTPVLRPASGPRDVGAFQFSSSQAQAPQPPSGLRATVQ